MKILFVFSLLISLSFSALACDEQCRREQAMQTHKVELPKYLTWQFCEDTKMAFIERDIPSLQAYRADRMTTKYRGSMRNTKNFIEQRKEWLQECNDYRVMTGKAPLFKDEKTTSEIFTSIESLTGELGDLISGVTYSADSSADNVTIAGEKFDQLFKLVDDHKTLLMLKGQFVSRN